MLRPGSTLLVALSLSSLFPLGCSPSDSPDGSTPSSNDSNGSGADAPPTSGVAPGCDPLVPSYCGFPFPSNVHLAVDPSSPTRGRVHFTKEMLPKWGHGAEDTDPTAWSDADGFSPGGNVMTHLPGATVAGLPTQDDLGLSVTTESPTILMDADTGELVPHFAELDRTAKTGDDERTFLIRPMVRLKDATRYLVAIRHVVDDAGQQIPPTPAFRALRDGAPFGDGIDQRRDTYADIFAKLEAAGVERGDLQLAWDFTTASRENNTGWMIHMRDEALAAVGAAGPAYAIDQITDTPNAHIRRRIEGHMTVPLYLDTADRKGTLVFGDDGLPKQNGTHDVPFVVNIPNSVCDGGEAGLLQNGHGLLGSKEEGQNGWLAENIDATRVVQFAVDWLGMANGDIATVLDAIANDPGDWKKVVGRQHQGFLDALLAMRMMKGSFYKDASVTEVGATGIDPTKAYYRGDSQGGIFGATYMAITTDVTRGLLGEPGAPYTILLSRSADFLPFFTLIHANYASALDIQMDLGLIQMLWDRVEPDGYIPYIRENLLPNTPAHEVLLHVAIGDRQVTPLGAHFIARTIGAKNLSPTNRELWGIDDVASPFSGSALVEFGFDLPEAPKTNVPPTDRRDPHEWVRKLEPAYRMQDHFFRTGEVIQTCPGPSGEPNAGPCVFPQMD